MAILGNLRIAICVTQQEQTTQEFTSNGSHLSA